MRTIKIGDHVKFSHGFCKAMATAMPYLETIHGKVLSLQKRDAQTLARVRWNLADYGTMIVPVEHLRHGNRRSVSR